MSNIIKKFDEFNQTNEIFSTLASSIGKLAGKGKNLLTGKKNYAFKEDQEDNDFANNIVSHIKKIPDEINEKSVLNRVFKNAHNWYYIIIQTNTGSYKIDAIKHKDSVSDSSTEYTITKQSVEEIKQNKKNKRNESFSSHNDVLLEASISLPKVLERPIKLKINNRIKKSIFKLLEEKYKKTNPKY